MMMIRKRKLFSLSLAISLLVINLLSMGAAASTDTSPQELSLEKAVELALSDNPQVELNRITVEKAGVGKDKAESQAEKIDESKDSVASPYLNYEGAVGQYVGPRKAEMDLTLAQNKARALEDGLKISVESKYYDVLKYQAELKNKKLALERAKEKLRLAEVRLEAGTVPKTDVMQAEVDAAMAEADVSRAENTLELGWMKLNEVMGQELDEKWILSDNFNFEPLEIKLEDSISQAKAKDLELIGLWEGAAVAEASLEQAKKYYTPNVYTYREAKYSYEEAAAKLRQAEVEMELKVREANSNLISVEKSYKVLKEQLEVMRERERLANLQYEVGMITQFQSRQVTDQLEELEAELNGLLYKYNLLAAQFKYDVFSGGAAAQGSAGM